MGSWLKGKSLLVVVQRIDPYFKGGRYFEGDKNQVFVESVQNQLALFLLTYNLGRSLVAQ